MSKIDDVAELLIEEIDDFKKEVIKLDVILKNIPTANNNNCDDIDLVNEKINALSSLINNNFKKLLIVITSDRKLITNALHTQPIKQVGYPKWLITTLLFFSIFSLSVVSYSFYKINSIPTIEEEYYTKGRNSAITQFRAFADDNKCVIEAYRKWQKKK